jgi:hypothetical protein
VAKIGRSRCGSHSARDRAQSIKQSHSGISYCLLLFFWMLLADSAHLTAVWCIFRYLMTFLAGSENQQMLGREAF